MTKPVLIAVAGARWLRGCEARHKAVHLRIGGGARPERESTPGHPGQRIAHEAHRRERQAAAHGHAPHAKTLKVCDRQPGLPASRPARAPSTFSGAAIAAASRASVAASVGPGTKTQSAPAAA